MSDFQVLHPFTLWKIMRRQLLDYVVYSMVSLCKCGCRTLVIIPHNLGGWNGEDHVHAQWQMTANQFGLLLLFKRSTSCKNPNTRLLQHFFATMLHGMSVQAKQSSAELKSLSYSAIAQARLPSLSQGSCTPFQANCAGCWKWKQKWSQKGVLHTHALPLFTPLTLPPDIPVIYLQTRHHLPPQPPQFSQDSI